MKLRSRIVSGAMALVIAAAVILTGCGGGGGGSSSSSSSSTNSGSSSSSSNSSSDSSSSSSSSSGSSSSSSSSSSSTATGVLWTTTTDSDGITTLTGYDSNGAMPTGNVTIPSQVGGKTIREIGDEAFKGCKTITGLTIPGTVELIGHTAFMNCSNLKSVTIQNGVKEIAFGAFAGCVSLKSIIVPDSFIVSNTYEFTGGANYYTRWSDSIESDGTGSYKVYTYYNGTNKSCIFAYCTSLESAKLSSGSDAIMGDMFKGCTSLKKVYIPASVKYIFNGAFEDCSGLTDIYYGGSDTEWANVEVGENNTYLNNATIHFESTGF